MIYIFEIIETNYFKLGFTKTENVYYRIKNNGFYTNKHPTEICNKLGHIHLKLLFVYQGDISIENYIKKKFPPICGEFYNNSNLDLINAELAKITEPGYIFDKPNDDFFETVNFEKLPCCGGHELKCNLCDPPMCFPRLIKYQTHKNVVRKIT